MEHGDGDGENREPMGEIRGAIQGIHHPEPRRVAIGPPALLRQHPMIRKGALDASEHRLFGGQIGFGDQIDLALIPDFQAALEMPAEDPPGLQGSLHSNPIRLI